MQNKKDILKNYQDHKPSSVYNVPDGYFDGLNNQIFDKINNKSKVISLNFLFKYAAAIALIIGSYFLFNSTHSTIEISYADLNESIDEYMSFEDELFYTFVTSENDESMSYLDVEQNISDYLEIEIH